MELIDYNGDGRWSREVILQRYAQFAAEAGVSPARPLAQGSTRSGDGIGFTQ